MSEDSQKRQPPAPVMRLTLQGAQPTLDNDEQRRSAINQAFDYRGDVTIQTTDGRTIEGYIFDRREDADPPVIRILTPDGGKTTLRYDEIAALIFTGRDTAEGRSWETWVRKYVEKKLAGETASIEPEKLD